MTEYSSSPPSLLAELATTRKLCRRAEWQRKWLSSTHTHAHKRSTHTHTRDRHTHTHTQETDTHTQETDTHTLKKSIKHQHKRRTHTHKHTHKRRTHTQLKEMSGRGRDL